MFEEERAHLKRLPPVGFDLARVRTASVDKQFRVALDSNTYSVPSRHVGQRLTLKAWADRVCLYAQGELVARHERSMQRNKDFEHPEHAQQLVAQRHSAREQRLLVQFLALSPRAQAYRQGLQAKRVNARVHLRQIVALAEMHGREAVARALDDGLELQAFSAEYIALILAARQRIGPGPGALQLTRTDQTNSLSITSGRWTMFTRCWVTRPMCRGVWSRRSSLWALSLPNCCGWTTCMSLTRSCFTAITEKRASLTCCIVFAAASPALTLSPSVRNQHYWAASCTGTRCQSQRGRRHACCSISR